MSLTPGSEPVPPMVSVITHLWSQYDGMGASAPASGGWWSANGAQYIPIVVPSTCVVRRLWWANGSTVSASYNVDVGVYADADNQPGVKLVSTGSTAQGTATQVQFVDVTDTTLAPGAYWLAMSCSSTSATFFRCYPFGYANLGLFMQQATALPLPATATPVEATSERMFLFGFATTASP